MSPPPLCSQRPNQKRTSAANGETRLRATVTVLAAGLFIIRVNLTKCRLCRQMTNVSNTMCTCQESRWIVLWLTADVYSGNVALFFKAYSLFHHLVARRDVSYRSLRWFRGIFFHPYGLTSSQLWLLAFIKHYIMYSIRANAHVPKHVYFEDEHLSSVSLMLGQIPAKRERHLCSLIMHCLYSRSSVVSSLYKMQSCGIRCRKMCTVFCLKPVE